MAASARLWGSTRAAEPGGCRQGQGDAACCGAAAWPGGSGKPINVRLQAAYWVLSPPARPRCQAEPCPGATRSTASGWQLLAPAAELHSPRLGMKTCGLYLPAAGISRGWHPAVVICGAVKQHRDRNEPWEPRPDRARERAACPRCAECWGETRLFLLKKGGKEIQQPARGLWWKPKLLHRLGPASPEDVVALALLPLDCSCEH